MTALLLRTAPITAEEVAMPATTPDHVYVGELMQFPGPWQFLLGRSGIILVSDEELATLASNPDKVINLSTSFHKREQSLRQICERAQARGQRTLMLAFDYFFRQYRPGTNEPRRLMPDTDEYIAHIAAISKFAEKYGLAMELSLLSPLEIGPGYRRRTGESGMWMQYRKGLRDPRSGAFSVQLWRHQRWANNKGPVDLEDAGVRVFAFAEDHVRGTPYLAVDLKRIVEITDAAQVEEWPGAVERHGDYRAQRIRVFGNGRTDVGALDRVLVVQQYRTPEMDYFSDRAAPFLANLIDRYVDAGVRFNALYSDEMHIQQDWAYFSHHEHGEFALRYVSDGFRRRFAERYGPEYEDFAKCLVYFCRGQEDFRDDLNAKSGWTHVFGESPEEIRRTFLFRARYYRMLQDGVVDLFVAAKRRLEEKMGYRLLSRAHATWAESPTIDYWETEGDHRPRHQYEYTPNFVWSCTVHQAAAACADYFKWGEFLTGTGNDHSEGGWLDRDYFGLALACSTGIVNEIPYSYAAHWGSPREVAMRRRWLQTAYGAAGSPTHGMVQGMQHRDAQVLMLYPIDLVSVDERFGSWMTQYGYANYITAAKLVAMGTVNEGAIELGGRKFTTLVALFEPHPPRRLLHMMRQLMEQGGRIIWSGTPPLLDWDGQNCLPEWQDLFGLEWRPTPQLGVIAAGERVLFRGPLSGLAPQTILTDFTVDRVHPIQPRQGSEVIAEVKGRPIGAVHQLGNGAAAFLGFRPRDDQSQSLGYDARWWFDILDRLGAYPPTGRFPGVNDNTEALSRTGDYLCCRFPNGAVSICPHLRTYEENWPGGFARKPAEDQRYLDENPPPPPDIRLDDFHVAGHTVTYHAQGPVTFRLLDGQLVGFAGHQCRSVTIDGETWSFADERLGTIAWAPVAADCRVPGGAVMMLRITANSPCEVRVPAVGLPDAVEVVAQGAKLGSRGGVISSRREGDSLLIQVPRINEGRTLFVVPK